MLEPDYIQQALSLGKDDFARKCPFYFLLSTTTLVRPQRPRATAVFEAVMDTIDPVGEAPPEATRRATVLAVRKVQKTFPSMITVGRTQNNDMVVHDIMVSRFHAYFRLADGRVEIGDAGSQNGTWIGDHQLVPKGPAEPVSSGDMVRIANHEFEFLDADACWRRLRKLHES